MRDVYHDQERKVQLERNNIVVFSARLILMQHACFGSIMVS